LNRSQPSWLRTFVTSGPAIGLGIFAVFFLALALRLVAGLDYPFHPDAAYMALKAQQVYDLGRMFEPRPIPTYPPLWPYALAYSARLVEAVGSSFGFKTSGLSVSDIYLPPVAGACLALSTVALGRVLYDWKTGLFAGFGVAISPLALTLSARGATDHDAFSLTLIVLTVAAFVACFKILGEPGKPAWARTTVLWLAPGTMFTFSLLTWKGSILITLFVAIIILARLFWRKFGAPVPFMHFRSALTTYTAVFFAIPTALGYSTHLSQTHNMVLTAPDILGNIWHYVAAFLAGAHLLPRGSVSLLFSSVGEYQPQSVPVTIFFLGVFAILAPLSLLAFLEKPKERDLISMGFFLVMFAAAFRSTDITFLAVPFVSLAAGRFLSWVLGKSGVPRPAIVARGNSRDPGYTRSIYVSIALICLIPVSLGLVTTIQYAGNPKNLPAMSSYWFPVFDWMKTSTSHNSLIFCWWDYGYWVSYFGERLPVIDNGYQPDARVIDVAKTLVGSDPVLARQIIENYTKLDGKNDSYFMITSADLSLMPLFRYAATFNLTSGTGIGIVPVPQPVLENSLYFRLFFSNATIGTQPIPGFKLVYSIPQVQVYHVILPPSS
jgi:asparagine N-glycosylation enzyme membrane subunit Stt3